jgi:hypothetical protein
MLRGAERVLGACRRVRLDVSGRWKVERGRCEKARYV